MNWKSVAAEDLERYGKQKKSLDSLYERISILTDSYTALRPIASNKVPVRGDTTQIEDVMLNNIVEREKLKNTYSIIKRLVKLTEKGLSNLSDYERRTLELFYIRRQKNHVDRLMEEFGYEKSKVYNLKEKALYNFTIGVYGLSDYYTDIV
ncbi:MAG: hypothetical protein M0R40_02430 [Firmicutes bacterium]|nr:hypothetical protein [Bacillota bacterium]